METHTLKNKEVKQVKKNNKIYVEISKKYYKDIIIFKI